MKIKNETHYDPKGLREIISRVSKVELDSSKRRNVTVTIKETVRGISRSDELGKGCLGHAWIGGTTCTINVPRNFKNFDAETFAHVTAPEFAHLRGMRHVRMTGNPRYAWVPSWRYDKVLAKKGGTNEEPKMQWMKMPQTGWREVVREAGYVEGIEVRLKPKKVKPKKGDEAKMAHAIDLISSWETKKKRAETYIKKYRRKVRYYEKKIAASARESSSPSDDYIQKYRDKTGGGNGE